jgi:hypothetical protein
MSRRPVLLVTIIVAVLCLGCFILALLAGPNIAVDYVKQFNELRKPANYDPAKDGMADYVAACRMLANASAIPEPMRYLHDVNDTGSPNRQQMITWPGDMDADELAAARTWLADNARAMDAAQQALGKEQFWPICTSPDGSMNGALPDWLTDTKNLCYAMRLRARMLAYDGHVSEGLHQMVLAGHANKCFGRPPNTIEWLIGIAVTSMSCSTIVGILDRTQLSDRELSELSAEIASMGEPYKSLDPMIDVERLYFMDAVQRHFTDTGGGNGRFLSSTAYRERVDILRTWRSGAPAASSPPPSASDRLDALYSAASTAMRTEDRKRTVERYDKAMSRAKRLCAMSPWQWPAQGKDSWQAVDQYQQENAFVAEYDGNFEKMAALTCQMRDSCNALVAAIAVLRYRLAHAGLPEDLDAVVESGYLKEVHIDSFSGKPLIYRVTGDDFIIYSVGPDGKDDGGKRRPRLDMVYWPAERLPAGATRTPPSENEDVSY